MNKKIAAVALMIFMVPVFFTCNDAPREMQITQLAGLWDIAVFQQNPATTNYLVEVTTAGKSGVARVKIINDQGDNSGPSAVVSLKPVPLGACGMNVVFSALPGDTVNLQNGDRWSITLAQGNPPLVQAYQDNTSTGFLAVTGVYTCWPQSCPGGLYQSGVPLPWDIKQTGALDEYDLSMIDVTQTDANFTGTIAEQTVLSLFLVDHLAGDTIQLCYQRQAQSNEQGTNFFRVRLVNGNRYETVESLSAPNLTSAGNQVCYKFQAQAIDARVDFIASLADFDNIVWLDSVVEDVNGVQKFADGFETGDLHNDLGPTRFRWQLRAPAQENGESGVSPVRPLLGKYSYRALGGRTLDISGSIVEGENNQLLSLLGLNTNLGFQGVLLRIYENFRNGYLSSLAGAFLSGSGLLGTFTGEKPGCLDQGQFIVAINPSEFANVSTLWTLTVNGQAQNCGGLTTFTKTFAPFIPLQKADRYYSDPNLPVLDGNLAAYQLNGRVMGAGTYFTLEDYTRQDYRNALFYGIINPTPDVQNGSTVAVLPDIVGTYSGWLVMDKNWRCQSTGSFTVSFPRTQ
jgi:hypothetical protein